MTHLQEFIAKNKITISAKDTELMQRYCDFIVAKGVLNKVPFSIRLRMSVSRVFAAFKLIGFKSKPWILITMTEANLIRLITDNEFEADMLYGGMSEYMSLKALHEIGNIHDDIDLMLEKAKYHAKWELKRTHTDK